MSAFLACEASTDVVSAALFVDGELRATVSRKVAPRSSGSLLELVPPMLKEAGVSFADLVAGLAIGRGPGSYAGLRTCVATANGWALPFQHRVWAVRSPMALAAAYFAAHPKATRCVVAGRARRDTFWRGTFVRAEGAAESFVPAQDGEFELVPAEPPPEADVLGVPPAAEWIGRLMLAGVPSEEPLPLYMHPAVATPPRFS